MNSNKDLVQQNIETKELLSIVVEAILDKKGKEITQLDLKILDEAPTDYFIICHGDSTTQVKAIADHILAETNNKMGIKPNHIEGQQNATWILIDYFDTVIHLFSDEARQFYRLEDLWSDAKVTNFSDDAVAS